jgi:predicted nucleic acid-binding Zn ribbon protein
MGDVTQTKACPLCAETIKAAARVCSFCRAHQSRFALWREQLGQLALALPLMAILILVCFWVFPDDGPSSGRNFARHREDLRVLRTSLEHSKPKPEFWLTGYVTNRGDYPWRVRELELRLLDSQGNLLDVRHSVVSDPFVVLPGCEDAFRVNLGEVVFTNSDVVQQVRVQTATDGNLPVKSD